MCFSFLYHKWPLKKTHTRVKYCHCQSSACVTPKLQPYDVLGGVDSLADGSSSDTPELDGVWHEQSELLLLFTVVHNSLC